MIRRESGDHWLLIRQIDHARLAAEIAAAWGNRSVPKLPEAPLLIPMIRDHDHGWREWGDSPRIDPESGVPRNFTEMPMPMATDIWSNSIDACRQLSPLAGVWVSRHFLWLARAAHESRKEFPEDIAALDSFIASQEHLQQQCEAEACDNSSAPGDDSDPDEWEQLADAGFRYLQFFDALSLWLCCVAPAEQYDTEIPGGGPICFIPTATGSIEIEPFPLSVERLQLSAEAVRIPAEPLACDDDLRAAIQGAPTEQLCWEFVRSS